MIKAYTAIIEGKAHKVRGFDEQGQLVLDDGSRCIFTRLKDGQLLKDGFLTDWHVLDDEPGNEIFGCQLLEIATVTPCRGDWRVNGDQQTLKESASFDLAAIPEVHGDTTAVWKHFVRDQSRPPVIVPDPVNDKLLATWMRLKLLSPAVVQRVRAIAWFKTRDGANDWNRPILLSEFRALPQAELNKQKISAARDGEVQKAAAVAQAVNSALRATAEQLKIVTEPLRDMYRDDRLATARADALKAGAPELFIDTVTAIYHKEKFPSTDGLFKYIYSSPIAARLNAAGKGTSRANIARWLRIVRKQFERRGLLQPRSRSLTPKKAAHYDVDNHPAPSLESDESAHEADGMFDDDTDAREPSE